MRKTEQGARALEAAREITFEAAAQTYFEQHADKWKNPKHRAQFLSTLKAYAFPFIGKLPVAAIDTGQVLRCIEPIWKSKPETGNRVRGRIETVLDWAAVRGYRIGDNPARWKGHLSTALPARGETQKVIHHAALSFVEATAFMSELRKREGVAAKALEFTILTAARTGETIGATWSEIDFKARVWTVPAGRIKAGRQHRCPLSDRVLEILQGLPTEEANEFVFIGPRAGGLSDMAMASVLQRMDRKTITVHGMRSTFRDWAAERTNFPNHVVEMALAHAVGNAVERAYRRGDLFDKRIDLMKAWASYCATLPAAGNGNVVELKKIGF